MIARIEKMKQQVATSITASRTVWRRELVAINKREYEKDCVDLAK